MTTELAGKGFENASHTKTVEVGRGVPASSGTITRDELLEGGRKVLLVADERTWEVAGADVERSLREAGADLVEPMIYPGPPTLYASYEHCEETRGRLHETNVLAVAVGLGTLNDLPKLASGELDRSYAIVATAVSMDGYTGFGVPMTKDGVKITMPCPAPRVIVFDPDVAAATPRPVASSGHGDLSAEILAGADWMLTNTVEVDSIHPLAWELVQTGVRGALSRPTELVAGVPEAYEGLCEGFVLPGLAMQVVQSTRPTPDVEHYFNHLWELDHSGSELSPPLSHGSKVAIGTLMMVGFYERLLGHDVAGLDIGAVVSRWPPWDEAEKDIRRVMSGSFIDKRINETREKYANAAGIRARIEKLVQAWPQLRAKLAGQLMPAGELQLALASAGVSSVPSNIGLTPEDARAAFPCVIYYRSRCMILDAARELGRSEEIVDDVFAPGGLWR